MSKKWFSYFAASVVLFVGFFVVGKKSRSSVSELIPDVAEESPTSAVKPVVAAKSLTSKNLVIKISQLKSVPQVAPKKFTPNLKSGELFHALFDGHALTRLTAEDLQNIAAFFAKPYPQKLEYYQAQMVDRLGVLKALEQQPPLKRAPSSVVSPQLISFYKAVLESKQENWLVKRQVFKNLKGSLTSKERETYISRLDSRIVSLATSSESEILERVLNEKRAL